MERHRHTAAPSSLPYCDDRASESHPCLAGRATFASQRAPSCRATHEHTHAHRRATDEHTRLRVPASLDPTPVHALEPLHVAPPSLAGLTILAALCVGRCHAVGNATTSPWSLAFSRSAATAFTTRVVLRASPHEGEPNGALAFLYLIPSPPPPCRRRSHVGDAIS